MDDSVYRITRQGRKRDGFHADVFMDHLVTAACIHWHVLLLLLLFLTARDASVMRVMSHERYFSSCVLFFDGLPEDPQKRTCHEPESAGESARNEAW